MSETIPPQSLLEMTTDIVAAHVGNNEVAPDELPGLLREVHATLRGLGENGAGKAEKPRPAVPIKKSVFPDYIVCLEDGKKLKMLKRHLKTAYGLTPDAYRQRWGLPADYPMVAPNYARHRSSLAKKIGLGTAPKKARK